MSAPTPEQAATQSHRAEVAEHHRKLAARQNGLHRVAAGDRDCRLAGALAYVTINGIAYDAQFVATAVLRASLHSEVTEQHLVAAEVQKAAAHIKYLEAMAAAEAHASDKHAAEATIYELQGKATVASMYREHVVTARGSSERYQRQADAERAKLDVSHG